MYKYVHTYMTYTWTFEQVSVLEIKIKFKKKMFFNCLVVYNVSDMHGQNLKYYIQALLLSKCTIWTADECKGHKYLNYEYWESPMACMIHNETWMSSIILAIDMDDLFVLHERYSTIVCNVDRWYNYEICST